MQLFTRSLLASLFVGLCAAGLAACGSSGDSAGDTPVVVTDSLSGQSGDTSDSDQTDSDAGEPVGQADSAVASTGSLADSFGPPRYLTSDCGSLPISEVAFSGAISQPARLAVGEIGRGRIIPGSTDRNENYWSIDLEPGFYHLVADVANASGESLVGITVTEVGPTGESLERILHDPEADFRARAQKFLEIPEAKTFTFKIESPYDKTEDYTLGVFLNGTSVPSPYFEECPVINTLSVGTTESLVVKNDASADEIVWYRLDVGAGPYLIESTGRKVDGSLISFSIWVSEYFGQNDDRDRVLSNVSTEDVGEESGGIDIDGPVWLTVRGGYQSTGVEFTVQAL